MNSTINWGLTQDLVIYLADRSNIHKAWFSSASQKKYIQERVTKLIPSYISVIKVDIDENKFNIYLKQDSPEEDDLKVFIKDPRISNNEIEIVNINSSLLKNLIIESEIINGKVTREVEAVFSSNSDGTFGFVHDGMKLYSDCFDEMVRQLNCSINKKTTKWIPGHRYDSTDSTLYYLGEFYRKVTSNGEYSSDPDKMKKYKLVTNDISNCTSINDVLKTKPFIYNDKTKFKQKGIYFLEKSSLMVDSGETIKNDVTDIELVLWNDIINNSENLSNIFVALSLTKDTLDSKSKSLVNFDPTKLIEIVKDKMMVLLSTYARDKVLESNLLGNNGESNLVNNFIREYLPKGDGITLATVNTDGYINYFKDAKIDLNKIALEIINYYTNYKIFENFDVFHKYYKYYDKFNHDRKVIDVRNETLDQNGNNPYKDLVKNSDILSKSIKSICNYAIDNHGIGVTDIYILSDKSEGTFYRFDITLEDILNSKLVNITEELKNQILARKFCNVRMILPENHRF